MTGREYLTGIREQLENGRHQHRMGISILEAFGYVRRRQTAIKEINDELSSLGLKASPPIDAEMPFTAPRIIFSLVKAVKAESSSRSFSSATPGGATWQEDTEPDDAQDENGTDDVAELAVVPSFKVAELAAAQKAVECIGASETIQKAYTVMSLKKYSQLVVADSHRSRATDIKGIISYQSIARASLHGSPKLVKDCLDKATPQVNIDDDINEVIDHLIDSDVVLVIGRDRCLVGIVTAWDLADEFQKLIGPFKLIGEIESRLRACLFSRVDKVTVYSSLEMNNGVGQSNPELLTLGELVHLVSNPKIWEQMGLPFDRHVFTKALDDVRELRNRLMHFRDELKKDETEQLRNFCQTMRRVS